MITRDNIRTLRPHLEQPKATKKQAALVLGAMDLEKIKVTFFYFNKKKVIVSLLECLFLLES